MPSPDRPWSGPAASNCRRVVSRLDILPKQVARALTRSPPGHDLRYADWIHSPDHDLPVGIRSGQSFLLAVSGDVIGRCPLGFTRRHAAEQMWSKWFQLRS
jgi:hypothetical protein